MPLYAGILVSCQKNHERRAASELHFTLTNELEIEKSLIKARQTRISGLVTVGLSDELDYEEIIHQLHYLDKDNPYFMHCLKFKPIHKVLPVDIDLLVDSIRDLQIQREGTFKIEVNKRHTPLASMDVISPLAMLFDNPVDLENPDWLILVEIVADQLGYAVISPASIYSSQLAFQEIEEKKPNWFLE